MIAAVSVVPLQLAAVPVPVPPAEVLSVVLAEPLPAVCVLALVAATVLTLVVVEVLVLVWEMTLVEPGPVVLMLLTLAAGAGLPPPDPPAGGLLTATAPLPPLALLAAPEPPPPAWVLPVTKALPVRANWVLPRKNRILLLLKRVGLLKRLEEMTLVEPGPVLPMLPPWPPGGITAHGSSLVIGLLRIGGASVSLPIMTEMTSVLVLVASPLVALPAVVLPLTTTSPVTAVWVLVLVMAMSLLLVSVQVLTSVSVIVLVELGPVLVIVLVSAEASPVKPKQTITMVLPKAAKRCLIILVRCIITSPLMVSLCRAHCRIPSYVALYEFLQISQYVDN